MRPPSAVGNHLYLVYDRDLIKIRDVGLFNGSAGVARPLHVHFLFARQQIAGNVLGIETLIVFQGKNPERGKVDPVIALFKALKRIVCFPRVGFAQVQEKFPLYPSGPRVFVLRVERQQPVEFLGDYSGDMVRHQNRDDAGLKIRLVIAPDDVLEAVVGLFVLL
jgi:hypothetical protein